MSLQSWPLSSLLKPEPESPLPGVKRDSLSLPLHLAVSEVLWMQVVTPWRWAGGWAPSGNGKGCLSISVVFAVSQIPSLIPPDPQTP